MAIDSVSKLTEYCLRKLGKPVINIEVDETQTKDRVNDAIKFFVERHFDGVEEIYFKKTILPSDVTNGYLTVDGDIVAVTEYLSNQKSSSLEIFDQAEYNFMEEYHKRGGSMGGGLLDYYMTQSYINTLNIITGKPNNSYSYNKASNKFYPRDGLTSVGSGNLLSTTIDMGDWTTTNSILTVKDELYPNDELEGSTITSDSVNTFGITQTVDTKFYVRGTYTAQIILKSGTYTGNVILELTDRDGTIIQANTIALDTKWKQFFLTSTYTTEHINDLTLNIRTETSSAGAGETFFIHSVPSLYKNNYIVVRGYRALTVDDIEIFEDMYLQRLTTAYIKQQWGSNLKKYTGVQLPGGVQMDGQTLFDEALAEINLLEIEIAQRYEMPDQILIG